MANHSSRQSSFQTQLEGRATVKRHNPTLSESALWQHLCSSRLGVAFHRQVPLDRYIVDFLAPSVRVIVEVDGLWRHRRVALDERRDKKLTQLGYCILASRCGARHAAAVNCRRAHPRSHRRRAIALAAPHALWHCHGATPPSASRRFCVAKRRPHHAVCSPPQPKSKEWTALFDIAPTQKQTRSDGSHSPSPQPTKTRKRPLSCALQGSSKFSRRGRDSNPR